MSAAEKMRTLVVGFWEDTDPSGHEAPEEIIRALPEIIAVVEAAERCRDEKDLHNWYVEEPGQPHTEDCLGCAVEQNHAALNAKLDPSKELA